MAYWALNLAYEEDILINSYDIGLPLRGLTLYTKPLLRVFIPPVYSNISERINMILSSPFLIQVTLRVFIYQTHRPLSKWFSLNQYLNILTES